MDTIPSPPPRPIPRRNGWVVYAIIATFGLCLSLLVNVALFGMLMGDDAPGSSKRHRQFEERVLLGSSGVRNKIAVIYLTGVIANTRDDSQSEEGMVGDIKAQLYQALEDDHVKGILLRINSPGGEVVASDAIYRAIRNARQHKPVVASIESVGASGAYYAALGAQHIMANDQTITGSIGVILQSFSLGGLMDKIGVRSHVFKSGRYKDILNPTREPTAEEQELVQTLIMEVYDKFVGIVAAERKLDVADLKAGLCDGRILSGNQAFKAGLVDSLGDFDEAVDKTMKLAGIEEANVITYRPLFSFRQLFQIFGSNERAKVQVELTPNPLKLEAGKLYFLPAYLFQ